jgi:MATE family multidrug resistance protein
MYGIEITFLFILSLLVGALGGAKYLAANQIALQYLGITMALVFCISQAITVQMGHLLGAQKKSQVFAVIWAGSGLSIGFTLILSFIFWFFPSYLIGIDLDISKVSNQQLVALSKHFLFLCGCYQLLEALRIALFGAIRALHDTQFTMWVSLFSLWGLALPLGFVLGKYSQMGAYGLWWGMMFGIGIGNIALLKRLLTKKYF